MDDFEHSGQATNANEEDLSLPKATINKFVQDLMPADVTCSKETKDLLADCCVEFIHLLSSEANEICEKETKKTIAGEHIVSALKSLGYESYIEHIQEVVDEHQKTVKKEREKKSSKKDSGLTQEELIKSQEALFAKARERMAMGNQPPAV